MKFKNIKKLITHRRSVFQRDFNSKKISKKILLHLLECADAAPTHKRTQPWRFVVYRGEGRQKLADALAAMYQQATPPDKFLEKKAEDLRSKALKSEAVIMISVQYSGAVPAWEELAATAAAVQNLWLAATAKSIGGYWSSPGLISQAQQYFGLPANEECLGFFYMGYHDLPAQTPSRSPLNDKIRWEE